MTRTPEYWQRRYEAAEEQRLAALGELQRVSNQLINAAADDQQQQIDALEQLVLNRAALISIERVDGRIIRFTFTRRGQVFRCETYGTWDQDVDAWRKALLED